MELLYSNPYLQVFKATNGGGEDYTFIKDDDKVVVLPYAVIDGDVKIMTLIEPIKLWGRGKEITSVTGTLEEGEEPNECAVRELEEEIGIKSEWGDNWTYVGKYYPVKGSVDCRHMYLVDITGEPIKGKPEEDGSYFEKVAKRLLTKIKVEEVSNDMALCFLIEKLKNKFEGTSLI